MSHHINIDLKLHDEDLHFIEQFANEQNLPIPDAIADLLHHHIAHCPDDAWSQAVKKAFVSHVTQTKLT